MRILLIDNHDSYSRLLHDAFWVLTGEEPLYYRNHEVTWDEIQKFSFDAVVISPGPGHPAVPGDFGVCSDLLAYGKAIPMLGICLGHQGMAIAVGGAVIQAPEPWHGRIATISHDGLGLFAGVEQGFAAVRYHSLQVLPASLPPYAKVNATAREDGLIMGLRFQDRPWHGLQFHPESIGTPQGPTLLAQFLKGLQPQTHIQSGSSLPEWKSPNVPKPLPIPFSPLLPRYPKIQSLKLPPAPPKKVFETFFANLPYCYWLGGAASTTPQRWPAQRMGSAQQQVSLFDWGVEITRFEETASPEKRFEKMARACEPLGWLGTQFSPPPQPQKNGEAENQVGETGAHQPWWVGHFEYEMLRHGEDAPQALRNQDAKGAFGQWLMPWHWIQFDEKTGEAIAVAYDENVSAATAWLSEIQQRWHEVINLKSNFECDGVKSKTPIPLPWVSSLSQTAHHQAVEKIKQALRNGETYEACLTMTLEAEAEAKPLQVHQVLLELNPAPYSAYWRSDSTTIISSSPELFLSGSASGEIKSRPIKGTIRRGQDAHTDQVQRQALMASQKDQAENLMITDLVRNDLCRVCEPGSVEVTLFQHIESHPRVFQMVSEIKGRRRANSNFSDLVKATFPGGSMTGAPKQRTLTLLQGLEQRPRGIYSGAFGILCGDGSFTLSMVIRTVIAKAIPQHPDRFQYAIGCGGAIVLQSHPDLEWQEAKLKAEVLCEAIEQASLT